MRRRWSCSLLALLLAACAERALLSAAESVDLPAAPVKVRVMTFNLRFASAQPPNAWPDRRPVVKRLIEAEAPDVIGTQEGLYAQLRDIAADLPDYEWIGLGREGGSRGEFMAVFYRKARFEPVAFDHFWLSDTPRAIGSITWGHKYQRMVTWIRFRERQSNREFYVWNTHFDHEVAPARDKAAALLRAELGKLDTVPLVLTGDFNCAAGASHPHETLTKEAGLVDTWDIAARRINEGLNTFHDYQPPLREGVRIDWILARGAASVERTEIVTMRDRDQYPSDHFPVVADLRL